MYGGEFAHFTDRKAIVLRRLGSVIPDILRSDEILPDVTVKQLAIIIRLADNAVPLARDGRPPTAADQLQSAKDTETVEIPI